MKKAFNVKGGETVHIFRATKEKKPKFNTAEKMRGLRGGGFVTGDEIERFPSQGELEEEEKKEAKLFCSLIVLSLSLALKKIINAVNDRYGVQEIIM